MSGPNTPGHVAIWATPSTTKDGGTASAGLVNSLGLYGNGGTPFGIVNSATPAPFSGSYTILGAGVSQTAAYLQVNGSQGLPFQIQIDGITGLQVSHAGVTLPTPLAPASGGTGLSSIPANGQLLIGNGTGYTLGTLTAGPGVSITNGAGFVTIGFNGTGTGTVTSVQLATGSTGLTVNGGTTATITTSGAFNLAGTLAAGYGGTGVSNTSLTPITATGSTTARTLGAMAGDVVNALNWGADPTGATECHSAIQAAINYAASKGSSFPAGHGAPVKLPAGTYVINATLTLPSNVVLYGDGADVTVLQAQSSAIGIMISAISTSAGTTINEAGVQDLTIFGASQATTGIQFQNNNRSFVRRCRFYAHNYGYAGADNWQVLLEDNWAGEADSSHQNNVGYYLFWNGAQSFNPNGNNAHIFQNNNTQGSLVNGYRIENGQGSVFTNCQSMGTSSHGWYTGDSPNVGGSYANLQFMFFDNCQSDTESDYGFMFSRGNAPVCTGLILTNIWAGLETAANKANIYLNGISDLVLNGFTTASSSYAVLGVNSNNLIISNGRCLNYDFYNTGSAGIVLQSCTNSQVIGCNVTPYSGASAPGVGVIETGSSNNNLLADSVLPQGYTLIGSNSVARDNMGAAGSLASRGSYLIGQSANPDSATVVVNQQAGGGNLGIEVSTSLSTTAYHMIFRNPNGQVGGISTSGSTTTYGTSSDYRLKENVVPLTGALARTAAIPVYRFNWKSDPEGTQVDGFLAHELAAHVPEAVVGEKDAVKADGRIAPQAVDQSKLVPLLIASVQELLAEVSALKAKVSP